MVRLKPLRRSMFLAICCGMLAIGSAKAGDLIDAIKERDLSKVHSLLAAGGNLDEQFRGDYPLNVAVTFGPAETVLALLDAGADIERANRQGLHPLHSAVLAGNAEIVSLLLQRGAAVDAKDGKGRTPLYTFAVSGGRNIEIAKLLLAAGADPNAESAREDDSQTALQCAAATGDLELSKLLLASGANVNHQSALGDTPLHQAVFDNRLNVAVLLIESGADVNIANIFKRAPLEDAIDDAMRRLLVDAGAR